MFAENRRFRNNDVDRRIGVLHQKRFELVGDERVALSELELRAGFARRTGRGDDIAPDSFQRINRARLIALSGFRFRLFQLRAVNRENRPLRAARADGTG